MKFRIKGANAAGAEGFTDDINIKLVDCAKATLTAPELPAYPAGLTYVVKRVSTASPPVPIVYSIPAQFQVSIPECPLAKILIGTIDGGMESDFTLPLLAPKTPSVKTKVTDEKIDIEIPSNTDVAAHLIKFRLIGLNAQNN